jgi:ribonuclease BN (tRNA processing enzyme)
MNMATSRQIRVHFLGTGDNFGSGGRLQSCIYVNAPQGRFLMDCGASALISLRRFAIPGNDIDFIVISHLHGDHFAGIPFFILEAQLISRRRTPLVIAGPPGLTVRVRDAMEVLYPGSSQVEQKFAIRFLELPADETTRIGDVALFPVQVIHGSGAPPYALRISCGERIIAYSGDTEWTDALCTVAADADLFICESYFYDKQMKNHINYQTLMAHRAELTCRRLILTHLGADMLGHLEQVAVETAEDGQEILL